jgi:hypothetical protein
MLDEMLRIVLGGRRHSWELDGSTKEGSMWGCGVQLIPSYNGPVAIGTDNANVANVPLSSPDPTP